MCTSSVESAGTPAPWFALRVRARSEHVAASALRIKGYDPFAPTYKVRRNYSDRAKTVEAPLFPGYIFCKFSPADKFGILNSPAVSEIVGFGGAITPIPDDDILAVRRALTAGAAPSPYLRTGHRVRITRGVLAGIEGVLKQCDAGARVVISVDLLEKSISIQVSADDITPL